MKQLSIFFLITLLGLSYSPSTYACDCDHNKAREAVRTGKILPLQQILKKILPQYPGEVVELELEQHRDNWIYEIKLLRTDGAITKLKVDAKSGEVLKEKHKR